MDSGLKMASRRAETVEGVKEAFEAALKASFISNRGSTVVAAGGDTRGMGGWAGGLGWEQRKLKGFRGKKHRHFEGRG